MKVFERTSTLTVPGDFECQDCDLSGKHVHVFTEDVKSDASVRALAEKLAAAATGGHMELEIHCDEEFSPPVRFVITPGQVVEEIAQRVWPNKWPAPQTLVLSEEIDPDRTCPACGGSMTTGIFYQGKRLVSPHCTQCGRVDEG